jgi:hypothetical protein
MIWALLLAFAAFNVTCNRLEAGGSKLEAWLTVADFSSFASLNPGASSLYLPWLTA